MKLDQKRELSLNILTDPTSYHILYDFDSEIKEQEDVADFLAFLDQYFAKYPLNCLHYTVESATLEKRSPLLSDIISFILSLDEFEFEKFSALVCRILGFQEFYATKKSGDQGIDFIAYTKIDDYRVDYKRYAIGQSKKYKSGLVEVSEVRELAGSVFLFKNKEFSSAKKLYQLFDVKSFTPTHVYFLSSYFFSEPSELLCRNSHIIPLDILDISLIVFTGVEKGIVKWKKSKKSLDRIAAKKDIDAVKIFIENEN
ncbi:MAG: hypothetical protein C0412_17610 [Flavobacterium sp.]|nr:hypothetical protein [Flavobacterium sp.]